MSVLVINGATGESFGTLFCDPDEVMRETWGHMDAKSGVVYPGTILYAGGQYGGDSMILKAEFGDAGYGPWFYYGIHEWLAEQDIEESTVYLFTGTYQTGR